MRRCNSSDARGGPGGAIRRTLRALAPALALAAIAAPTAAAAAPAAGAERVTYRFGPIQVAPGANTILVEPNLQKPDRDGYITRIRPDLVRADGTVPNVDVIHLHHGVWINESAEPNELFFASGEEKTVMELPPGYGYPTRARDRWLMNHMIHNLTMSHDQVWIVYEVDFVPASSAEAASIKPARPLWMDVQAGSAYPVFDVLRGSGGDGRFTYPDEALDPYPGRAPKNQWVAPRDGTLIDAAGHVHPGGLWTDLDLVRPGAVGIDRVGHTALHARLAREHRAQHRRLRRIRDRRARSRRHRLAHRRIARRHVRSHPGLERRDAVRVFRSEAEYYDPAGPISWDMSMTVTPQDWRVGVRKGDRLRISATYETERASWYESMGIMLLYWADEQGPDPFTERIETTGPVTHGHLPENENYGGVDLRRPDPATFPDGAHPGRAGIAAFQYLPGDQALGDFRRNPPAIDRGQSLRFENLDWPANVFHTVTACRPPCNGSTGISYPLADGPVDFDSGQLGFGPPGLTAAAQRSGWNTPRDLEPGTYTFFCRVHPFMRGSFRVRGASRSG